MRDRQQVTTTQIRGVERRRRRWRRRRRSIWVNRLQ
jgi:hypothetical protein